MMNPLSTLSALTLGLSACTSPAGEAHTVTGKDQKPNIIFLYADDLGFGDVGCYGATDVKTPNIDALAEIGLRFTDAHCSAATCTPSRFSLLTGTYAVRNNAAILPGDAPLLIRPGTTTVASMLKDAGYKTAVVGKWHLGLGNGHVDWNKEINPGPLEIGFDYSFLVPATPDRVPCVYVENHRVADLDPYDSLKISYDHPVGTDPTGLSNPEMLKFKGDLQHSQTIVNGVSRIGFMTGGNSARWKDEQFASKMLRKSRHFIQENRDQPFFLYLAFTDIHVPRMPNPKFVGKTQMGARGDAIAQLDDCVGQIMRQLVELGIDKNTLVIFSSDNGPVLDDGYDDQAVELLGDHKPAGPYSGGKYSILEGGTRMPFIVSWPGVVEHGTSNALVSQVDLLASLAKLVGQPLKKGEAGDSFNLLPAFLGKSDKGRETMFEEAFAFGLRQGKWKYVQKSNKPIPDWLHNKKVRTGIQDGPQLYDLSIDPAEVYNVADKNPQKINEMKAVLDSILQHETRPGFE